MADPLTPAEHCERFGFYPLPGELESIEAIRQHILNDIASSLAIPPKLFDTIGPEADTPTVITA